jgi:predicted ATPase
MRIAVSGTHGSGKSTLIEAFLDRHQNFAHEPEPYAVLQELYGEAFAEEPSIEDFQRQLDINMETLRRYDAGDNVIFERSPFDFLAYMLALGESDRHPEAALAAVRSALPLLDAVVFLPLEAERIDVAESEDLRLREAVDDRLHDILLADEFDLFTGASPLVVEVRGSVEQRLLAVEASLIIDPV